MPLGMPDASIPLGVNTPSLNNQLATIGNLQNLMQQSQEKRKQDAVAGILGDPDAIDPATGIVSQNALGKIAKLDPGTMQKLVQQNMSIEDHQRALALGKTKAFQDKMALLRDGMESSIVAYDEGKGGDAGQTAAQSIWDEQRANLAKSGAFSEDEVKAMPQKFDPLRFKSNVVPLKDFLARQDKDKDEKRDDDKFAETKRHDKATEGTEAAKVKIEQEKADAEKYTWQPGSGPDESGKQVAGSWRYPTRGDDKPQFFPGVIQTGKNAGLTPEQSQDEDTKAKMIAEYRMAPMGTGMGSGANAASTRIMAKAEQYAKDNGYTWDATKYKAKQDAIEKFAAKGGADQLTRINTAIQHADTFDEVAAALKNGDNQAINYAASKIAAWSGKPAPTNLEGVKAVFGPEIASAITGIGGQSALEDRKKFEQQLSLVKSPEQMSQLVDNYTSLLAGRTKELELQFTSAMPDIGKKNVKGAWEEYFNTKLDPETKTAIARTSAPREGMVKQTEYGPGTYRMGKDGKLHLAVQKDGKNYIVKDVE